MNIELPNTTVETAIGLPEGTFVWPEPAPEDPNVDELREYIRGNLPSERVALLRFFLAHWKSWRAAYCNLLGEFVRREVNGGFPLPLESLTNRLSAYERSHGIERYRQADKIPFYLSADCLITQLKEIYSKSDLHARRLLQLSVIGLFGCIVVIALTVIDYSSHLSFTATGPVAALLLLSSLNFYVKAKRARADACSIRKSIGNCVQLELKYSGIEWTPEIRRMFRGDLDSVLQSLVRGIDESERVRLIEMMNTESFARENAAYVVP